jgi:hypothetical protein
MLSKKQIEIKSRSLVKIEKCEICGSNKTLSVHHKDKNRQNNKIDNLMVLCNSCHQKTHFKERNRCPFCKVLIDKQNNHNCEELKKAKSVIAKYTILKRERCVKCGKLLGKNNIHHSCKHPRGMLGKRHKEEIKKRISEKCSILKKQYWKNKKSIKVS